MSAYNPIDLLFGGMEKLGPCAGMPGLVLPAGMTTDGLPVGIEREALPGRDRALLSLGLAVEQALGSIPAPRI
jgi:Asp-tRNA(Asn)/Glu-tRNA(Gln) amidotransferase A subunit family amidase